MSEYEDLLDAALPTLPDRTPIGGAGLASDATTDGHECDGRGIHKLCAMTSQAAKADAVGALTVAAFVDAARALKAAESAYLAAQQQYAEAVKKMSEEAVR